MMASSSSLLKIDFKLKSYYIYAWNKYYHSSNSTITLKLLFWYITNIENKCLICIYETTLSNCENYNFRKCHEFKKVWFAFITSWNISFPNWIIIMITSLWLQQNGRLIYHTFIYEIWIKNILIKIIWTIVFFLSLKNCWCNLLLLCACIGFTFLDNTFSQKIK